VLLVARSLKVLKRMVAEMREAVADVGLEMHFGKTKFLANEQGRKQSHAEQVNIDGVIIDILKPDESTKYLGRELTFADYHDREIRHRIACGWAKFSSYKAELCDRRIPLHKRLKLFSSVVTPTVLYASGCWTMTTQREQALRVAQRRMLRKIVQVAKLKTDDEEEEWVNYILRSTRIAERCMEEAGIESWVGAQRRRKLRWAGHLARLQDRRWTQLALYWTPSGHRRVGRPLSRWEDSLVEFFRTSGQDVAWYVQAQDRTAWRMLEESFVS